ALVWTAIALPIPATGRLPGAAVFGCGMVLVVDSWYSTTVVPATGRPCESSTWPVMKPRPIGGTATGETGGAAITNTGSTQVPEATPANTMVSWQVDGPPAALAVAGTPVTGPATGAKQV